jgi:hypothetical protein
MHGIEPDLNRPDRPPMTPDPKVMAIRRELNHLGFPRRPSDFNPSDFE